MKILHLSKYYPPFQGGIETFLYDLNECLTKDAAIQSDILCFSDDATIIENKENRYTIYRNAVSFVFSSMPISFQYLINGIKNIKKYDIVHLHYPNPWADATLLLSLFRGKVVVHWHSDILKPAAQLALYAPLNNWLLNRADCIIATSPNYAQESTLLQKYKAKVVVIPLGLDLDRVPTPTTSAEPILEKYGLHRKKIIFSLGRHIPYKGFEYLIEAAKHLPDDYVILIGGKGSLFDFHKKIIADAGLNEKVILLGFVSEQNLPLFYSIADIFVMSSVMQTEAFGMVQLEALAYATPIVSTAIPCSGVSWVNQHKETGLIVPIKDPIALSDAIKTLIESPDYDQYATRAKQRFDTFFRIEVIAAQIKALYQNVLIGKP